MDLDKLNHSDDANENSMEENLKEVKNELITMQKPSFDKEAEKVSLMTESASKKLNGNGVENNESMHQIQPSENTVTLSNHEKGNEIVSSKIDPNFRGTNKRFFET